MSCSCRTELLESGQVWKVQTCPSCLLPGAITWLIENGRQLDMFSDTQTPLADEGFVPQVDSVGSVSASRPRASFMRKDYMTQGLCSCDLPF